MKKLLLTLVVCLVATVAFADLEGAWTAQISNDGRLFFNTTRHPFGNWGMTHDITDFTGLARTQVESQAQVPVQFQLRRDAGTVAFEGTFRRGFGAGQLTFVPNVAFANSVRGIGLKLEKSDDEELFRLALMDVSVAYLREMHGVFPDADAKELSRMRAVGVTSQWLRELRAAGVGVTNARDAKKLAGSGVTAKFVEGLAKAGYKNLSIRDLTRLAAVGVDDKFIREMSRYGEK